MVLWLARGLKGRGHEVTVAALEGSLLPEGVALLPVERERSSALDLLANRLPTGIELVHFMAPPEPGVIEKARKPWDRRR